MNLEKEVLETALKRYGQFSTVERVISMEAESALPKGENYLSVIYRITMKVVLGNGRTAKKSLILKVVPPEKAKTELVKSMGVFKSETMMYTIVLREMEALMEEFGDTNDPLWCRLLHYEPYNNILLEDLKASGFKMTRRQDCLDLDHAMLVLRSLGRFHGMSKILEQRGVISREDYKPYALVSDKNLIKFFMYYGLQTLSKAMEEHWGPEWYDVAQKLKIPCDVLQEKMLKLGEIDESRFNCLNHGDCWSNNMMFKYDWQNRPFTMRFLDLQIVHYNSVAYDLHYVLHSSFDPQMTRENYDRLLKSYLDSLNSTLDFYRYNGDNSLDMETLKRDLDHYHILKMLSIVMVHPVVTNESDEVFDLEVVLNEKGEKGLDPKVYNERYKKTMGPNVRILADRLGSIWMVENGH